MINDLNYLRNHWKSIPTEAKLIVTHLGISADFPSKRQSKRKHFFDEQEQQQESSQENAEKPFQHNVFNVLIDSVISGLTTRYTVECEINNLFDFLWMYKSIMQDILEEKVKVFIQEYFVDVSDDLIEEIQQLKVIYEANFGSEQLSLLNNIYKYTLQHLFPNCCIALGTFCPLPVTVAEAEQSFSKLKLIKNYLRTTMSQECLSNLLILSNECPLARILNFDNIIDTFARKKARKAHFV